MILLLRTIQGSPKIGPQIFWVVKEISSQLFLLKFKVMQKNKTAHDYSTYKRNP
jgi:hypothetical protein